MYKYSLYCIIVLFILGSCSPKVYPPSEHIVIRDSVAVSYRDSVVLHHQTVSKDYTGLLDTLKISGERSSMLAYTDTTHFIIKGELREEPVKEQFKEKIVYKEHRDTTYIKEPYPVEVEKKVKYVPAVYKYSLAFTIIVILILTLWLLIKFKVIKI